METNGLSILDRLTDKTWKATFTGPRGDQVTDVVRWERALNGRVVRSLHSLNAGMYGGETLFLPTADPAVLEYHYFTTEGFRTQGTLRAEEDRLVTHERVHGSSGGIDEVRGTTEFAGTDGFRVVVEYHQHGQWVPARDAHYRRDDSAAVVFRPA